jgi:hypothetical protein
VLRTADGPRRTGQTVKPWCIALALLVSVCLAACGSGGGPAVVSVEGRPIDRATVAHWTRVFALGGPVTEPHGGPSGTPRAQALAFLLFARWQIGEAAREGLAVGHRAVEQRFDDRKEANGASEFEGALRAAGQTSADVELEIEAELAGEAIRRMLDKRAAVVTQQEIVATYRRDRSLFRVPEVRAAELIEYLPSRAAASALVRRIGTGKRFSDRAYHELLRLDITSETDPEKAAVLRAMFAARLGVPTSPMKLNRHWTVLLVRRIIPARIKSLSEVHATVVRRLVGERRRTLAAEYLKSYRDRWTARTRCSPGYVVQGCVEYGGPTRPEADPFSAGEEDRE